MSEAWSSEDGGPQRQQTRAGVFAGLLGATPSVTSRDAFGATMVVLDQSGRAYLQGNAVDEATTAWVERIDPITLECLARIDDLPGGARWPGGIGVLADGSLLAIFGNHAHRLSPELEVLASVTLPRERPYNSFVTLTSGHLVTKDFGGTLPGAEQDPDMPGTQLLVLDPESLEIIANCDLPERSIARLSADGDTVYIVGDTSLMRATWNGSELVADESFMARYRTIDGQSYGWDAVIALGAAWFLDNGEGSQNYIGTFRGVGANEAPLHLIRVDLGTAAVSLTEVCGLPGGVIANPPLIDADRRMAVAYDSGNGVLAGFAIADDGSLDPRWSVEQNHGSHLILDSENGLFLSHHHDNERWMEQYVVRDIVTGAEVARLDSGSPMQSVLFPAVGTERRVYSCTFTTVSTLSW
jgi:hypothetical protein